MAKATEFGNKILDRLPAPDRLRIAGEIEAVSPPLGEVVAEPGKEPKWVHFPISCVLSSMVVLENGSTVEASTVGNEGMLHSGLGFTPPAITQPLCGTWCRRGGWRD